MRNNEGFDARKVIPVFFVEVNAPSGILRTNSADRDIMHEGNLYKGVGSLGSIGDYTMTTGTAPTSLRLTLIGISTTLLQQLNDENMRNREVKVWMALLDNDHRINPGRLPFLWFKGRVDTFTLGVGKTISASITASSRLINWARSVNARYTHEDQRKKHPGDDGFKFVNTLHETKLTWGS